MFGGLFTGGLMFGGLFTQNPIEVICGTFMHLYTVSILNLIFVFYCVNNQLIECTLNYREFLHFVCNISRNNDDAIVYYLFSNHLIYSALFQYLICIYIRHANQHIICIYIRHPNQHLICIYIRHANQHNMHIYTSRKPTQYAYIYVTQTNT